MRLCTKVPSELQGAVLRHIRLATTPKIAINAATKKWPVLPGLQAPRRTCGSQDVHYPRNDFLRYRDLLPLWWAWEQKNVHSTARSAFLLRTTHFKRIHVRRTAASNIMRRHFWQPHSMTAL